MGVFSCDTFCASAAWIYSARSYKHIIILDVALGSFADKSYLWTCNVSCNSCLWPCFAARL